MSSKLEHLSKLIRQGFIAKALLEDYANVVSKLEQTEPQLVKDRVLLLANKFNDEFSKEAAAEE